ncbi:hypothetical protein [Halorubrum luteum]
MTSYIVEYVSDPVTRSFDGGRTYRPKRPPAEERSEVTSDDR